MSSPPAPKSGRWAAPDSVVRRRDHPEIIGFKHFVDLIGNRVTVADILEVRGIEIDGQNFSALSLCSWFNQTPHYLRSEFVGGQVWGDELSHGLNLAILGTHMQVRRSTRFSEAIIET